MRFGILFSFLMVGSLVRAQISQINLSVSPAGSSGSQQVTATLGQSGWMSQGMIQMTESTVYNLTVQLGNAQQQIMSRSGEVQFFPALDPDFIRGGITYIDKDDKDLPVGFQTQFTLDCVLESESSELSLVLSDFGINKAAGNTASQGDTLFLVKWPVEIMKDPNAPPCENEEEIITDVLLSWIPLSGGDTIVARAQDPDGEGPLDLEILDEIRLPESAEYRLKISLLNEVEGEDIAEEILEEADEHIFFFAFSDEVFQSPSGDGNIDNRADPVNYLDGDDNQLPLGLSTRWTTACTEENLVGTFRLVLKHQPGIKSVISSSEDGSTDVDLEFKIEILNQAGAPPCENEEEVITDVVLTWIPMNGGDTIVARAHDPDGEGPLDLEILDEIELRENTSYQLSISIRNEVEGEDITDEIREEADEHLFFFEFTENFFSNPPGNGNLDNRADSIVYLDQDNMGLPLGLITGWTTGLTMESEGNFRIILKHQPDIKSAISTAEDGGTDLDITFKIRSVTTSVQYELAPEHELIISPNPASESLTWELPRNEKDDDYKVTIFSLTGQIIQSVAQDRKVIALSQIPPGIHLLQIQSNKKIWMRKFVKLE